MLCQNVHVKSFTTFLFISFSVVMVSVLYVAPKTITFTFGRRSTITQSSPQSVRTETTILNVLQVSRPDVTWQSRDWLHMCIAHTSPVTTVCFAPFPGITVGEGVKEIGHLIVAGDYKGTIKVYVTSENLWFCIHTRFIYATSSLLLSLFHHFSLIIFLVQYSRNDDNINYFCYGYRVSFFFWNVTWWRTPTVRYTPVFVL